MKVEELRIGSWVLAPAESTYHSYQIKTGGDIDNAERYRPIPLTPELLEKCGFEKVDHIHGYSFHTLKQKRGSDLPRISIYDTKTEYMGYMVAHCQYLHQLQNLFFALTQTELKPTI